MLVAVTGFGSVWRRRFGKNQDDPLSLWPRRLLQHNRRTIGNEIRQRPKITGYARFNGCGGFDPNRLSSMIGRVFECAEPCVWQGANKLLFMRTLSAPRSQTAFSLWCGTRCMAR